MTLIDESELHSSPPLVSSSWLFGVVDTEELDAERAALTALSDRLAVLTQVDLGSLDPDGLASHATEMVKIREQLSRQIGVVMRVGDLTQTAMANGEKSMAALVQARAHVAAGQATSLKTVADSIDLFPTFDAAFKAGEVTLHHVETMRDLLRDADSTQVMEAEAALCVLAVMCPATEFRAYAKVWEAAANPTEHLHEQIEAEARQHLIMKIDLYGNVHVQGTFSPTAGQILINGVRSRSDQMWRKEQADHNQAPPEHSQSEQNESEHAEGCALRPKPRRDADALIDLVLDGLSAPAGSKRPKPVVNIICTCNHAPEGTIDHTPTPAEEPEAPKETDLSSANPENTQPQTTVRSDDSATDPAAGEDSDKEWEQPKTRWLNPLSEATRLGRARRRLFAQDYQPGGPVPPPNMPSAWNVFPQSLDRKPVPIEIVAKLAAEGTVITHFANRDGNPLDDPPPTGRDFTDRQKRWIRLRDRHCQHHGCLSPAKYCDYDHLVQVTDGGPTKVANGQLLCKFHHRWKHRNDPKPFKRRDIKLE